MADISSEVLMRSKTLPSAFAALLVLSLGCSNPFDASDGAVSLSTTESSAVLQNNRSAPIGYIVFDRATVARVNWAPCAAADCPVLQPGESLEIQSPDIMVWGESDELIAYWWHIVRDWDGDYRIDRLRHAVVSY